MQLLTHSALLKALGWSLFNSLWQMALLWLSYRILLSIFRTASAHARHSLALLFVGVGTASSLISFFYLFFNTRPGDNSSSDGVFWAGDSLSFWKTGERLVNEMLPYCSLMYLLVLAFLFIRWSNQYLQSRQLKSQGLSKIQPAFRIFVTETSQLMGIRKEVQVWLSTLIEGPVTLGFFKPVILVPLAMASHLSPQQVEAILLHELAHIKRNDYLLHLGVTIVEMLFFFNPFTRWLIRDIQREREHCCDDLVMQFRYDPHTYVSALLSLATVFAGRSGHPQLALAATGGNDHLLLKRVRRILKLKETNDRPGARTLIFLLLTLAGSFLFLSRTPSSGSRSLRGNTGETAWRSAVPSLPVLLAENHYPIGPILGRAGRTSASQPAAAAPLIGSAEFVSLPIVTPASGTPASPSPTHTRKKNLSAPLIEAEEDTDPEESMVATAAENAQAENASSDGAFATVVQSDDREYSMYSMGPTAGITPTATTKIALKPGLPFIPHSSFSFQLAQDTARLAEQYAYMQSLASHELEEAVKKMQKELLGQLRALKSICSNEQRAALLAQKELLEEQLKLQEQFLKKQQALERKLERAGKVRRIVVI